MNMQTLRSPVQPAILSPGLHRAAINSHWHQRIVVGLDGSASMTEEDKSCDAWQALLGLLDELNKPINKNAFEVAVLRFAEDASVVHGFEPVASLRARLGPGGPDPDGAATNITSALSLAHSLLQDAGRASADGLRYVTPLCLILTDGLHNLGPEPWAEAASLKSISDVLTVAFGSDADERMLAEIATEQLSIRCRTGADLRCYFAQVGRTLTVTRTAGMNVASALAAGQQ